MYSLQIHIVLRRNLILLEKKPHSDSTKKIPKLVSSQCSSFCLTIYFYVWWTCFSNTFDIPWVPAVLLFPPTCSYIRMRQTSYRIFSRRYQRGNHNPQIEDGKTTQWPKEKRQKDNQRYKKNKKT